MQQDLQTVILISCFFFLHNLSAPWTHYMFPKAILLISHPFGMFVFMYTCSSTSTHSGSVHILSIAWAGGRRQP